MCRLCNLCTHTVLTAVIFEQQSDANTTSVPSAYNRSFYNRQIIPCTANIAGNTKVDIIGFVVIASFGNYRTSHGSHLPYASDPLSKEDLNSQVLLSLREREREREKGYSSAFSISSCFFQTSPFKPNPSELRM